MNAQQPEPKSKSMSEVLAERAQAAQTATPPHKLEMQAKEDLLRKARVVRDKLANRGSELTGQNPAKAYRWVNVREDRQTYFQALGWEVCRDPEVKSPFLQADGSHRRADVILYEMSKDFADALDADSALRGIEGIEGHQGAFINTLHAEGVKEYRPAV